MAKTLNVLCRTCIFLFILNLGFASAALVFNKPELSGTVEAGKSIDILFKISNTDNSTNYTNITYGAVPLSSGTNLIDLSFQTIVNGVFSLPANSTSPDITYRVNVPANATEGVYTGKLRISGTGFSPAEIPVKITVKKPPVSIPRPCQFGRRGSLRIIDFGINNLGAGTDDEWEPLDEIEIEIEIENTNEDESVKNVDVKVFVFDDNTGEDVTNDFDFEDEKIDLGRIARDSSEVAKFRIKELPADLEEGKYRLYFKAFSSGKEDEQCVDSSSDLSNTDYHLIEYVREEDEAVIVRPSDLTGELVVSCGDKNVRFGFPVYNIGTDKEEKVLVNVYNKRLGIDLYEVIENLRSGKKKNLDFFFDIPEDAEEGLYKLEIFTHYQYDDGDELDESSYDAHSDQDLDRTFVKRLRVSGCKTRFVAPSIGAKLDSEKAVGKDLRIVISIKNNNAEKTSFSILAENYESWAELKNIQPGILNLEKNESGDSVITLVPKKSGQNTLNIIARDNEGNSYNQPITIRIEEGSAGEPVITGSAITKILNSKVTVYVLSAAVIILLVVILVLASKRGRRD